MKTYTVTLKPNELKLLEDRYSRFPMRRDIQHTLFQVKGTDFTLTAYKSGKVVIQGEEASFHAQQLGATSTADKIASTSPLTQVKIPTDFSAGSDEVGTGDYFGPVVVCAAIVRPEDLSQIPTHLIMDSKMIKDEAIRELAPKLKEILKYSLLILDNRKYNKIHTVHNMNAIKALLHNKAYLNLAKRFEMPVKSVVDQFMPEASYYKALRGESEVYKALHFETKAENKYLAVACASIIARDAFLDYFDKLAEKYDFDFPKGAGSKVDEAGKSFVKKFGKEALNDVAKVHFANTDKILTND